VVVYDNGAFGLITLEGEALGLPAFREAIEFPNPDYVALARACGGQGFRASQPGELHTAIEQALATNGPTIVDCAVAANEMPNFPHVDLAQMDHYAIAKVKEVMRSFVGR
jgi:pyruvate dehydrogenase (quinone)